MRDAQKNENFFMSPMLVTLHLWVILCGLTVVIQGKVYMPVNYGIYHAEGIAAQIFGIVFSLTSGFLLWRHYRIMEERMNSMAVINLVLFVVLLVACVSNVLFDLGSAILSITVLSFVFCPFYMEATRKGLKQQGGE